MERRVVMTIPSARILKRNNKILKDFSGFCQAVLFFNRLVSASPKGLGQFHLTTVLFG